MKDLTLGSLFDGMSVFPLAASRYEITPIWASEIEKAPISITKRHFPNIHHLGDITKVKGGEIPPVHIITFGSPCQNLSNIGKREGITGSQSSLFYHTIRIIKEMRCATNGTYPVIAVWENVMGAFSSNNRLDFKAVLESFTNTEIPTPASEVWANAGMVRGNDIDVAWRLLDAQYWGRPTLAQRRRRMRSTAKERNKKGFHISFGRTGDPFPTLLAGSVNYFSFWYEEEEKEGFIRQLTPLECERLMGLPEGWTALGYKDEAISDYAR